MLCTQIYGTVKLTQNDDPEWGDTHIAYTASQQTQTNHRTIRLTDSSSPQILSWTFDGATILDNDYVSTKPTIVVTAKDSNEGIKEWTMQLIEEAGTANLIVATKSVTETTIETSTKNLTWIIDDTLKPERYWIQLHIVDNAGHSITENSALFICDNGVKIRYPLAGPNPYNSSKGNLSIQYELSDAADMTLRLYAIDGEEQWSTHVSSGDTGGKVGFNTVTWDGKNNFGETAANGAYVVYIQAKGNGTTAKRNVKVLILK